MTEKVDVNDRARQGTLPADPSAETKRVATLRVVSPDEKRAGEISDVPAERALIGAMLWAGANAPDTLRVKSVLDILETSEPFYVRPLRDVYDAMVACATAGVEHDVVAVHTELVRAGHPGHLEALERLKAEASTVSERQARAYAKSIKSTWAFRCVTRDMRVIVEDSRNPKADYEALVERGRAAIRAMSDRWDGSAKSVDANSSAQGFFKRLADGGVPAMSSGLADLDTAMNGGFRAGEVSVLAARTSVGKSTLAAQIAEHIVTSDLTTGVLYVSLEMHHELFTARLISARSGVPISNLRRGVLNQTQWANVTTAVAEYAKKGLFFTEAPTQTMASVYASAVERKRILERDGKRLAMVVIDYIGLVKPSAEALKKASREQQVAEISRGQRLIASELGVHVLGLAQIGRDAEKMGAGSMPKLWHLRESGAIENDADAVLIMHRERDLRSGLFKNDTPPALSLAKARLDETAVMLLDFDSKRGRFANWTDPEKGFSYFYGDKAHA